MAEMRELLEYHHHHHHHHHHLFISGNKAHQNIRIRISKRPFCSVLIFRRPRSEGWLSKRLLQRKEETTNYAEKKNTTTVVALRSKSS